MDAKEFWCRAFLAAMGGNYVDPSGAGVNHALSAAGCAEAADAALAAARERGMISGEQLAAEQKPDAERVEFTAERDGEWWLIDIQGAGRFRVTSEEDRLVLLGGRVMRIKWGESMPPKPIEVWIERGGRDGA